MPTYMITGPDGSQYEVTGPGTEQEALDQVRKQVEAPSAGQQFQSQAGQIMKDLAAAGPGTKPMPYQGRNRLIPDWMEAATEGSEAGLLGGFDDEISSAMGDTGADARKESRRADYPGASIAGELTGGLALGANAAKNGLTLFGRAPALMAAPAEGAIYGGVYGAGEAKPGERTQGLEQGAVTGALTGLALHGAGKVAEKALTKAAPAAAAPAKDALQQEGSQLYTKMAQSGVTIKPEVIQRLKGNIAVAIGKTEPELAPKATALAKMANRTLTDNAGIGDLHNFAKAINQELRGRLEGADAHYVPLLKSQVESLIEQGSSIANIPGNKATEAFQMWKQADEVRARYKKTATIEKIMDQAEVDATGRYTQSGLANAIRREMNKLHKAILAGKSKGWTQDEIALIRQMAKGGLNSHVVNLMAKFAPRGVVSAIGGFALGGPGLTIGGHVAGQMADRGAAQASVALRDGIARGYIPQNVVPQIANKLDPFIQGIIGPANERRKALAQF